MSRLCSIEGCGGKHIGRGFCQNHYMVWRHARTDGPVCSVEGCDSAAHTRGWCIKHYRAWERTGDPRNAQGYARGARHGMYRHGREQHPLYATWRNMLARCEDPKCPEYRYYGARGLTVCERWRDINNFISDMGERPAKFTLERVENAKGYSPENCVWADRYDQMRNRSIVRLNAAHRLQIVRLSDGGNRDCRIARLLGIPRSLVNGLVRSRRQRPDWRV